MRRLQARSREIELAQSQAHLDSLTPAKSTRAARQRFRSVGMPIKGSANAKAQQALAALDAPYPIHRSVSWKRHYANDAASSRSIPAALSLLAPLPETVTSETDDAPEADRRAKANPNRQTETSKPVKRQRLMRATGPDTVAWREHVLPLVVQESRERDQRLMAAFDHWKKLRADKLQRQGRCIGSQCPICAGRDCNAPHRH